MRIRASAWAIAVTTIAATTALIVPSGVANASSATAAPPRLQQTSWTVETTKPAAASAPAEGSGRVVEVQLGLDCGKLSGSARSYATERNLCPTGASTNTVVTGNCGRAWLFVVDDVAGDRIGRINFGAASILGPIVWHNFGVSWAYTPLGIGVPPETGIIADFGPYLGTTYDVSYTRGGLLGAVGAQLAGSVTLIWGGVCYLLPPWATDIKRVT